MKKLLVFAFLLVLLAPLTTTAQTKPTGILKGIGSFYHPRFNGLQTATGEVFQQSKLTAASNNFKFHSWVKVTNLENNKSVIVRINDRMAVKSAKKGRVVDLTKEAARQLGVGVNGLIKVLVELVPNSGM